MKPDTVSYEGPGRAASNDLKGTSIRLGLLLPRNDDGTHHAALLRAAAELAVKDTNARGPFADGRKLELEIRYQSRQWGLSSNEIFELYDKQQAVALITGLDGDIAHQAEQIANKISFPILTLASDASTTRINLPWIFRMGPSDAAQADTLMRWIAVNGQLGRVLLLASDDHDGRVGTEQMQHALAGSGMGSTTAEVWSIPAKSADAKQLAARIRSCAPKALVLWMNPQESTLLLNELRTTEMPFGIYVSRKAAAYEMQEVLLDGDSLARIVGDHDAERSPERKSFAQAYVASTGVAPGFAAWQMYVAVRGVGEALRLSGPNRARLRDVLSAKDAPAAKGLPFQFDGAGNAQGHWQILPVGPIISK